MTLLMHLADADVYNITSPKNCDEQVASTGRAMGILYTGDA